jgi:hypothetical protein
LFVITAIYILQTSKDKLSRFDCHSLLLLHVLCLSVSIPDAFCGYTTRCDVFLVRSDTEEFDFKQC